MDEIRNDKYLKIFVIAGEPSGDKIAAGFMREVKNINPNVKFFGVGGFQMKKEGMETLFPLEELSVMGLAEILPKLFNLISRVNYTASEILKVKPDAVLFVDAPEFCFNVAKKVRKKNKTIPLVHYVAPTVWAWREKRAEKISKFLDHLLTLFPFEPPYFQKYGLATTFVGHPVVEKKLEENSAKVFREKYNVSENQPILTLLPGSRINEITQLLEVFEGAVYKILTKIPGALIVIPTLPHLRGMIEEFFKGKGINPLIIEDEEDKFRCFSASNVAIAASGTVSLELSFMGTPHLVAYRINFFSALLAKFIIKTRYFNIMNIIARRPIVPELLQGRCHADLIADEALKLLESVDARKTQIHFFNGIIDSLGRGKSITPSMKAAEVVLSVIKDKQKDKEKK